MMETATPDRTGPNAIGSDRVVPDCTYADRAFHAHDHAHCLGDVLSKAERLAETRGARLTPVRRRALEILLGAHRAMGAYEVLERLAESGFGNQPPVAYRALDFLVDHGMAHRIQRLNAFMACMQPGEVHDAAFFICRLCHAVAEAPATKVRAAMEVAARDLGFAVERTSMEAVGLCPACAVAAP